MDMLFGPGMPAQLDYRYFGQHAFHQVQAKLAEYTCQLKRSYQLGQPLYHEDFVPRGYVTMSGEASCFLHPVNGVASAG